MKTLLAALLAAGLAAGLAGTADAAPQKKKRYPVAQDSYARQFPSATPRQLQNARAYDNGTYYEVDSNAHPAGSRSWWAMKERERGGDNRN